MTRETKRLGQAIWSAADSANAEQEHPVLCIYRESITRLEAIRASIRGNNYLNSPYTYNQYQ